MILNCFAFQQLFYEYLSKQKNFNIDKVVDNKDFKKSKNFFVLFIQNFMDERSRTIDTICFLIFLEIFYNLDYFSK